MDRYGYTMHKTNNVQFEDISTTGHIGTFTTNDDGFFKLFLKESSDTDFSFYFYGKFYDFLFVNVNGFISSDGEPTTSSWKNRYIPSTKPYGSSYTGGYKLIAPFWDDLNPEGGNLYFQRGGIDGSNKVIVQWDNFKWTRQAMDGHRLTFQVWLMAADENKRSDIYFLYKEFTNNDTGTKYNFGIENRGGDLGLGTNTFDRSSRLPIENISTESAIHIDSSGTR